MRRNAIALLVAGGLTCCAAPSGDRPETADLLIRGARIVDGAGTPWYRANLAVSGDRIVAVGPVAPAAAEVLDADGLVLAPGFIDMHAHSEYGLLVDPRALSKVAQGVTTEVLGEHLSAGPVLGPAVDDPMMVAPSRRARLDDARRVSRPDRGRRRGAERPRPTSVRARCAPR